MRKLFIEGGIGHTERARRTTLALRGVQRVFAILELGDLRIA